VLNWKSQGQKPDKETIQNSNPQIKTLLLHWDLLQVEQCILYKKFVTEKGDNVALVVPDTVRKKIFEDLHTNRISGHFGRDKTIEAVRRRFYWPGMTECIKR